ncbi:MAG: LruC domain-containing protein [Candidatus Cloacimonetes bacterium]|jgi:LruC domain-containing protein|nr:LruC domain-containing protein [Candidatus Cloacimonadota bacterium]MDD2210638.1 LruC domain-containing protein [Candidatus Cloacimonadota bacterium]MDD4231693.1 LruC domain-containing protein [Candidatus Cloacimonadota bacterium]MDY0298671.1 LruC domain-containing protein [Candidatus Cloacimonadaceae bacterium]
MNKVLLIVTFSLISFALFAQGTIAVWGSPHNQVARNVPEGDDFIDIAAGNKYGVALRADGSVVTWGQANQLVNNSPAGNDFVAISAGDQHAVALKNDGTVVAWGSNSYGQLEVPTNSDIAKVASGIYHSVALRTNGELVAWGNNSNGQCDVPSGTFIDVAAGNTFSLGIASSGEIVAWGQGWNNELNVPSGNDFVQVSAKFLHAIARRSNGSIVAWGNNTENLNAPTTGNYIDLEAGWQGNVAIRDDGELVAWANLWVLRTIPEWVQELDIVKVSGGDAFFLGLTGEFGESDADSDGVADSMDSYPDDPLRAYNLSYPLESATGWGTLAYEDLWPQKGDYDLNDLVLDYKISLVLDAEMKVKDIQGDFMLRAVGASKLNAFAIEFPFPTSNIDIPNSTLGVGDGSEYSMPVIEAGTNSILKVISSTADFVNVPGNGVYWNTQMEQPYFDPIPISFEITLIEALDQTTLPFWGFWNPYLMVDRIDGHEVHLPGYPPTVLANEELFGEEDDTTNPEMNRYYKTASNLPWALDLPIHWKYPIEMKEISQAYYRFAPWAESGGTIYQDWYDLGTGDLNLDFIYDR